MAKPKTVFVCSECGQEYSKWNGRCTACGSWNTIEEAEPAPVIGGKYSAPAAELKFSPIGDVDCNDEIRYGTGSSELDRVLGGGLVKGSLVLIGGDPGIGKSTLLLQICGFMGGEHTILYVSGEESERQIKLRADRLGVTGGGLLLASGNNCESIIQAVRKNKPDIVIIDSIQTITSSGITSSAGSVVQVRECTNAFMHLAKSEEIPIFIVSHVNKDGGIAGPKIMEHIVDTVLYFEGERYTSLRLLRAVKNRFGSTNEIGVFEMRQNGLVEVENPSEFMLNGKPENASGSVVACSMEGTRPILLEIQALVARTNFGMPRRTAAGLDYNRVNLLMAVLEKRVGIHLSNYDAYVNIAGGIKMNEPAVDLGIVMAIVSSYKNQPIDEKTIVFGEVGLSGEVRAVNMPEQRVAEAKKLGFTTCIMPEVSREVVKNIKGIKIIGVKTINEALQVL
mgnify:CR=1 FL=1